MRHIRDHQRSYLIGNLSHPPEIDHTRISTGPYHDHLGSVLSGQSCRLFVINPLVVLPHPVRHNVVEAPREIERMAVRQMSPVGQVHSHKGVARI